MGKEKGTCAWQKGVGLCKNVGQQGARGMRAWEGDGPSRLCLVLARTCEKNSQQAWALHGSAFGLGSQFAINGLNWA